jgi:hypothetical protein
MSRLIATLLIATVGVVGLFPQARGDSSRKDGGPKTQARRPADAASAKEGLALLFEQSASDASLVVKFILSNESSGQSFWVNAKLPVGHHADYGVRNREIEMAIMDARGRRVLERCADLPVATVSGDFVVLKPGEKLERDYEFSSNCYSFSPGEKLLMMATFKHLPRSPKAPKGLFSFSGEAAPRAWKEIVVPSTWREKK